MGSSVVINMQELRMKICNSKGCVITLLSMHCSSRYENFMTLALLYLVSANIGLMINTQRSLSLVM